MSATPTLTIAMTARFAPTRTGRSNVSVDRATPGAVLTAKRLMNVCKACLSVIPTARASTPMGRTIALVIQATQEAG